MAGAGDLAAAVDEMQAAREVFRSVFRADAADSAARTAYGNSTAILGDAMIEQLRFIEVRDLVAATLHDLGPREDELLGRLLGLHAGARTLQGDRDCTVADVERAYRLVRGGDPRIEVEVLAWQAAIRSESDLPADWDAVEMAASEIGMWTTAVEAMLSRLGSDAEMPPAEALTATLRTVELARDHGLTEVACRCRHYAAGIRSGRGMGRRAGRRL